MQNTEDEDITVSYVNISSSILRNKFEKNRALNETKKQEIITFNNARDLDQVNEKVEILNRSIAENDVLAKKNFLKLSEQVQVLEENTTQTNLSIDAFYLRFNEVQLKRDADEAIMSLNEQLSEINLKINESLNDFSNKNASNAEIEKMNEKLNDLNESVSEIEKLNAKLNDQNNYIEQLKEQINYVSNKQIGVKSENVIDVKYKQEVDHKIQFISNQNSDSINSIGQKLASYVNHFNNQVEDLTKMVLQVNAKVVSIQEVIENMEKRTEERINSTIQNAIKEQKEEYLNIINEQNENIKLLILNFTFPEGFYWKNYVYLNDDLKIYASDEYLAKRHYLLFGKKENRHYLIKDKSLLPTDFNWIEYLSMNIDIAKQLKNESNSQNHYLYYGIDEKRFYKAEQLNHVNYFIYSGRKSGSSTLNNSFLSLKEASSIQIHNNEDFLYKYGQCGYASVFDLIESNMKKHKTIYIIDSYRTPLEKKMSSFFEDIEDYIPNYKVCEMSYLTTYFNNKYIYAKNCGRIYTEDYEPLDEIMEHFNLPPLKTFDFDNKYVIVRHKNLVFVKVRFSEIRRWEDMFSKIIGVPFKIVDRNRSEDKEYYEVYEKFKNLYKVPKTYIDQLKTDKRFITYNSKNERDKYIKTWQEKSV
jgi:hypothetical protein